MSYLFNQNKYESLNVEITEKELTNTYQGQNFYPSYPRHIANSDAQFHRNKRMMTYKNRCLPKTCQIPKFQSDFNQGTHVALDILRYQLNDKKAKQTHLENVRRNLEQRLQAAKVSGNYHLIALLQKESQQLEMNV